MSLSRPGETEPIHSVSYGHVAACQLMGPHTLALRVGESQLLLQSPQVSGKRVWKEEGKERMSRNILLNTAWARYSSRHQRSSSDQRQAQGLYMRTGVSDTK